MAINTVKPKGKGNVQEFFHSRREIKQRVKKMKDTKMSESIIQIKNDYFVRSDDDWKVFFNYKKNIFGKLNTHFRLFTRQHLLVTCPEESSTIIQFTSTVFNFFVYSALARRKTWLITKIMKEKWQKNAMKNRGTHYKKHCRKWKKENQNEEIFGSRHVVYEIWCKKKKSCGVWKYNEKN